MASYEMKNKKSAKSSKRSKSEEVKIKFRERKFRDINLTPEHPDPVPGFIPTLPGPPGWQYKLNPGH